MVHNSYSADERGMVGRGGSEGEDFSVLLY